MVDMYHSPPLNTVKNIVLAAPEVFALNIVSHKSENQFIFCIVLIILQIKIYYCSKIN